MPVTTRCEAVHTSEAMVDCKKGGFVEKPPSE